MALAVKTQLLLGLQIEDISNRSLVKLRGKLLQLLPAIRRRISFADYGRCNLSLALIADRLGNNDEVAGYLRSADTASSVITYPKSILYLKKIGLLKWKLNDYDRSVTQFFKCHTTGTDKLKVYCYRLASKVTTG